MFGMKSLYPVRRNLNLEQFIKPLNMNIFRIFFFTCIYTLPSVSQSANFEGIIKYTPLSPVNSIGDTMTIYFGKEKIRISRSTSLAEKFGGLTDEITDFEKSPIQSLLYFSKRMETQTIEVTDSKVDSVKYYPDSIKNILGFPCIKSKIFFKEHEYMGSKFQITDIVWSATCLQYSVSESAASSLWHHLYSLEGIPLLQERSVHSKFVDGTQTIKSQTMIACEIIIRPLPDSVFKVP